MEKIIIILVLLLSFCGALWADSGAELLEAAKENDLAEVKRLIEAGVDIDYQDDEYNTALILAAMYDNVDIVEYLIDAGADLDLQNIANWPALGYAMNNGNEEIIKLLRDAGASEDFAFL